MVAGQNKLDFLRSLNMSSSWNEEGFCTQKKFKEQVKNLVDIIKEMGKLF